VEFVADINARGIGMYHFQADVFALDLTHHIASLLAVHLVPILFAFSRDLDFMLAFSC
jgi:hypothetical protein